MTPTRPLSTATTTYRRLVATALLVVFGLAAVLATALALGTTSDAGDSNSGPSTATAAHGPIDVDSLYAASTSAPQPFDTSYLDPVSPTRVINGRVSWYGPGFNGRRTANGERFDQNMMTAAHKSLPFGTIVRVVDTRTDHAVLVRINDRGPYVRGRVLDLSEAAARELGMHGRGTTSGRLEIFPRNGSDIVQVNNPDGSVSRIRTFDADARVVVPHGFTVKVADFNTFDAAVALYDHLRDGDRPTFLVETRTGSHVAYSVSVGLFNRGVSSESLAVELAQDYPHATALQFDGGALAPLDGVLLAGGE